MGANHSTADIVIEKDALEERDAILRSLKSGSSYLGLAPAPAVYGRRFGPSLTMLIDTSIRFTVVQVVRLVRDDLINTISKLCCVMEGLSRDGNRCHLGRSPRPEDFYEAQWKSSNKTKHVNETDKAVRGASKAVPRNKEYVRKR